MVGMSYDLADLHAVHVQGVVERVMLSHLRHGETNGSGCPEVGSGLDHAQIDMIAVAATGEEMIDGSLSVSSRGVAGTVLGDRIPAGRRLHLIHVGVGNTHDGDAARLRSVCGQLTVA